MSVAQGMKPYRFRSADDGFVTVTAESVSYGSSSENREAEPYEMMLVKHICRKTAAVVAVEGRDTVSAGRVAAFGVAGALAN